MGATRSLSDREARVLTSTAMTNAEGIGTDEPRGDWDPRLRVDDNDYPIREIRVKATRYEDPRAVRCDG
jgi:hypothetical protein